MSRRIPAFLACRIMLGSLCAQRSSFTSLYLSDGLFPKDFCLLHFCVSLPNIVWVQICFPASRASRLLHFAFFFLSQNRGFASLRNFLWKVGLFCCLTSSFTYAPLPCSAYFLMAKPRVLGRSMSTRAFFSASVLASGWSFDDNLNKKKNCLKCVTYWLIRLVWRWGQSTRTCWWSES